ncbi:MAG: tRNA lysidine(34) synthetase TilS [Armatimonadota bacterium]|nr:MAG: tRNA lysidine(34) synthetase TilS [Armatimonadota bacterium]
MLLDVVRKTIDDHHMVERGDRVLVAVSGGPDSVALLDLLSQLRAEYQLTLHVAHLNHMLRAEAEEEADFVRELAEEMGLSVTVESADVRALAAEDKSSLELAARNARREFLLRAAESAQAQRIALGHHADDRVETVLMRILRGTGVDGLAGIRPKADPFIRPLFDVTRLQIEDYIAERELPCRDDLSNRDPSFFRNRIRSTLLPALEDFQPGVKGAILRLSELAAEEAAWLREQGAAILERGVVEREANAVAVRLASVSRAAVPVQRRVLREAMRLLLGDTTDLGHNHVEAALRLVNDGKTGGRVHLPRNLTIERGYGKLTLRIGEPEAAEPVGEFVLAVPGATDVAPLGITMTAEIVPRGETAPAADEPPSAAQLDHANTPQPLMLRTWRKGDRFVPLGMDGSMKLHDFFVNEKVPQSERERLPLVTAGGDIAWVVGWRIDDRFKVTDATETVLRLQVRLSRRESARAGNSIQA